MVSKRKSLVKKYIRLTGDHFYYDLFPSEDTILERYNYWLDLKTKYGDLLKQQTNIKQILPNSTEFTEIKNHFFDSFAPIDNIYKNMYKIS